MKRNITIVIFLSLLLPSTLFSAEFVALQESADNAPYSLINKATIIKVNEDEVTIKAFETGGGDPAVNGNKLIVTICQWDRGGNCYTWRTGIDLYEVKDITTADKKIIIRGTEHVSNKETLTIETVTVSYIIEYFFGESNALKNIIRVEKI